MALLSRFSSPSWATPQDRGGGDIEGEGDGEGKGEGWVWGLSKRMALVLLPPMVASVAVAAPLLVADLQLLKKVIVFRDLI